MCNGALGSCQKCIPPSATKFYYYSQTTKLCFPFTVGASLTTKNPTGGAKPSVTNPPAKGKPSPPKKKPAPPKKVVPKKKKGLK